MLPLFQGDSSFAQPGFSRGCLGRTPCKSRTNFPESRISSSSLCIISLSVILFKNFPVMFAQSLAGGENIIIRGKTSYGSTLIESDLDISIAGWCLKNIRNCCRYYLLCYVHIEPHGVSWFHFFSFLHSGHKLTHFGRQYRPFHFNM